MVPPLPALGFWPYHCWYTYDTLLYWPYHWWYTLWYSAILAIPLLIYSMPYLPYNWCDTLWYSAILALPLLMFSTLYLLYISILYCTACYSTLLYDNLLYWPVAIPLVIYSTLPVTLIFCALLYSYVTVWYRIPFSCTEFRTPLNQLNTMSKSQYPYTALHCTGLHYKTPIYFTVTNNREVWHILDII